ncbi:TetR/AcrR family transcriptional regulator, partial [Klebsiella pneumoniae]
MTAQKDQDAPRRPGRPRGKKPGTANREQLMDIALTLFARDGAGRVSLNAIAKEAGVTPAMLHYYFSSRDALVTQLIEERFMPLRNHISRIFVDHPQDPVLALTMMVETLAHMAEKNAWFAPLWMQEIIGEMPILRQHMDARFGEERFQVMLGTVRRWQQEGKINPALAPELLFTTV